MNSPLLKYFILYSFVMLTLVLMMWGYVVAVLYFIVMMFFYSIIVSLWIDHWKKQNKLLVETTTDRWLFYIHGISVSENVNSLFNLHTSDEQSLELIFKKLFVLKLIVLLLLNTLAIYQFIDMIRQYLVKPQNYVDFALLLCAFNFTIFTIYRFFQCLSLINFINQHRWQIFRTYYQYQYYYSAYYPVKKSYQIQKYVPFLTLVFRC